MPKLIPLYMRVMDPFKNNHLTRKLPTPDCVPWSMVESHEEQAQANHAQTLKRLNERGGLDPSELLAVIEDRPWHKMDPVDATAQVVALIYQHNETCVCGAPLSVSHRGYCSDCLEMYQRFEARLTAMENIGMSAESATRIRQMASLLVYDVAGRAWTVPNPESL